MIQNTHEIDFLFSLEIKAIPPICLSDRTWYDMYWVLLRVEQSQMKTLIGPLSFSTLKPLLLFLIFECYLWLLGFFNCLLTIRLISFFIVGECFVHSKKQCCSYINKPTTCKCCHQEVFRQIGVRNSWQQQNPWKVSLNELRFNKNAVLQHATLLSQEK